MPRAWLSSLTGAATTTMCSGPSASSLPSAAAHAARSSGTGSVSDSHGSRARGLGRTRTVSITPSPWSCQAPDRASGCASLEDHIDHVDHLPRLDDLVHPEDAGTVHRGDGARSQRPGEAFTYGEVERLTDEVLVGQADQDRPPRRHHLVESAGEVEGVAGRLAEVVGRVDDDALPGHTGGQRSFGVRR